MRREVRPEQLEPHLEEGPHAAGRDHIGAVQVQEDLPDGQHLGAQVLPGLLHLCGADAAMSAQPANKRWDQHASALNLS